jgi:hypothetical protein
VAIPLHTPLSIDQCITSDIAPITSNQPTTGHEKDGKDDRPHTKAVHVAMGYDAPPLLDFYGNVLSLVL